MKKILTPVIAVLICGALFYLCASQGWLVPEPVRAVRGDRIEDLQQRADSSAEAFRGNLASSQKAGSDYQRLGDEYLKRQEWTPAIEAYEKAVGFGQNQPGLHHSLAVAYGNRGSRTGSDKDIDMAERHYGLAIQGNPSLWDAHYGLAVLKYFSRGRKEEAEHIVRTIIRAEPNHYPARFALGRFLYEGGKPSESLSVYEDVCSMLDSEPDIPEYREFRQQCRANIQRLMTELSRR